MALKHQWPVIRSTLRVVTAKRGTGPLDTPGPEIQRTVPAPDPALVADYYAFCGSETRSELPPHFFGQWGWPLITGALVGAPYDLKKAVNAGCAWTVRHPLPLGEPLDLSARLDEVDDDGLRALITLRMVTGTVSAPEALESKVTIFIPLTSSRGGSGKREKPTVPEDAERIAERALPGNAGLQFALLTGDFNPIHWLAPYAKLAGFGARILHGFAQAAIAIESVVAGPLGGDASKLQSFEARFTRPLRLPSTVGVFADGEALFVGAESGAEANMVGRLTHG